MRLRRMAALLLGIAFVPGCAPAEEMPTQDPAADRAAIEAVRVAEREAAEAGDVDAFMALLTDDVTVMPPNGPLVRGAASARAWLQDFMAAVSVSFDSYTTEEVLVDGDLAVERIAGVWTITPAEGGEPMTEQVKGLHVYRRQADGSWKLTHDIWNSDEPVPGM